MSASFGDVSSSERIKLCAANSLSRTGVRRAPQVPGRRSKWPGICGAAGVAAAVGGQVPVAQDVPVAFDQQLAAAGAPGAAAVAVVDVAGVGVAEAVGRRDRAGAGQSRRRRVRLVEHAEIGMERREVQRDVGAEVS